MHARAGTLAHAHTETQLQGKKQHLLAVSHTSMERGNVALAILANLPLTVRHNRPGATPQGWGCLL